jgi:hypothetical protein
MKDCTKSDNIILVSLLPSILELIASAFDNTTQSCILSAATAVIDRSTLPIIQNAGDLYTRSSLFLIHTFLEKCSSLEKMQSDPDVPFEFFEFLSVVDDD